MERRRLMGFGRKGQLSGLKSHWERSKMKYYFEVVVARSFGKQDQGRLTYHHTARIKPGAIATVPYGKIYALAIVLNETTKPKFATKPVKLIHNLPPLPKTTLDLMLWLADYYACGLAMAAKLILPSSLLQNPKKLLPAKPLKTSTKLPDLSADQFATINKINKAGPGLSILHGETASGKTRIYRELIDQTIKSGRDAIILVPEIALSTQVHFQLTEMLDCPTHWYHSQLKQTQRRALWLEALGPHQPAAWIGARSAVFLPLAKLGLIIIDEFHDSSYKQASGIYYRAVHVAARLAKLTRAKLVLGSATPSIGDYYLADAKRRPIYRITDPVQGPIQKDIKIVDMKKSKMSGGDRWLSREMLEGIESTLAISEQAIIFLNRRGSAGLMFCGDCGWQATCPNCQLPQTYHGDKNIRQCHVCGRSEPVVLQCPACGSADILTRGVGTKDITAKLQKHFPKAKIYRLDRDSFKASEFEEVYKKLESGDIDIVVGTQMIGKGFDLPRVSFIGLVHGDASLSLPDFAANERTYQLIHQVIGRGGRRIGRVRVVIQTFRPDHPAIEKALAGDWQAFYEQELASRQATGFPPFRYLLKLTCSGKSDKSASQALQRLADSVDKSLRVLGPAPALYSRDGRAFRWQLVILSPDRRILSDLASNLPAGIVADLDPINLL